MKRIYLTIAITILVLANTVSQATLVEVSATIDNTIFKGSELSNGVGEYIFSGKTSSGVVKRALVMFDLDSKVPDNVIVDSARIILVPTKVKPGTTSVKVYRVGTEWGEGTSKSVDGDGKGGPATKNDATWTYAKFNTFQWVKPGGDYGFVASDTVTVNFGEKTIISSVGITMDVKSWIEDPTLNFGWIFIGDESKNQTSVKFVSKDHKDNTLWPMLQIYYQSATSISENAETGFDLKVYQGGLVNSINISNPGDPGMSNLEIFSITGIRIFSRQFQLATGNNIIETGIHDPGIYVYRINYDHKFFSGKFTISNQ